MPNKPSSTARLEAFSDGVIAVIITIMVLELKVPHQEGIAGLLAIIPIVLVYGLSFAFTAIYWINHRHLIERIETADHAVLYANLVFLFFLSLLPFSTSYVLEKRTDPLAVSFYAVTMFAAGFSFLLLRLAVGRILRREGRVEPEDRAEMRKHILSLIVYSCIIPLAYFHTEAALIAIGVVTFAWILPTLTVPKNDNC